MMDWKITLIALIVILSANIATAQTPQEEGLAGAGRAGLAREAMHSNPAAVALLKQNMAAASYTLTRIRDLGDAGGIVQNADLYDGTSEMAHGGLGYTKEGRRVSLGNGSKYVDRTSVRTVLGRDVYRGILVGMKPSYTIHRENGVESKYFHADAGIIYPLFTDMPMGITVENVMDKDLERPRSVYAAISYSMEGPLSIYADIGRVVSAQKNGRTLWAFGAEIKIFDELVARAGLYRDTILETRGFGLGLSWLGPRTAFEYALRKSISAPMQMDHVFGINLVF